MSSEIMSQIRLECLKMAFELSKEKGKSLSIEVIKADFVELSNLIFN